MKRREAMAMIVETAREWPEGVDTTGRGLVVPAGHICIVDRAAAQYEKRYTVKTNYPIMHHETVVYVTLVDLTCTKNERNMSMGRENTQPATRTANPTEGCLDPDGEDVTNHHRAIPVVVGNSLDRPPCTCGAGFRVPVYVRPRAGAHFPGE